MYCMALQKLPITSCLVNRGFGEQVFLFFFFFPVFNSFFFFFTNVSIPLLVASTD